MMISQPALLFLEATLHRLLGRTAVEAPAIAEVALTTQQSVLTPRHSSSDESLPVVLARASAADSAVRDVPTTKEEAPLSTNEIRARAAALRALALGRGRRFDAARAAFTQAARLDPSLDLTRTPGFWHLERAAHEAAVEAYIIAGRDGDAVILRARIRSTYRPKPIRQRTGVAIPS